MGEKAKEEQANACFKSLQAPFVSSQIRRRRDQSLEKVPTGVAAPGEALEGAALARFGLCPRYLFPYSRLPREESILSK